MCWNASLCPTEQQELCNGLSTEQQELSKGLSKTPALQPCRTVGNCARGWAQLQPHRAAGTEQGAELQPCSPTEPQGTEKGAEHSSSPAAPLRDCSACQGPRAQPQGGSGLCSHPSGTVCQTLPAFSLLCGTGLPVMLSLWGAKKKCRWSWRNDKKNVDVYDWLPACSLNMQGDIW